MKYKLSYLFILLFIFNYAQTKKTNSNKQNLSSILTKLEKNKNVYFSYASKITDKVFIDLKIGDLTLDKVIKEIEVQSNLIFKKVADGQYIISENPNQLKTEYLNTVILSSYITSGVDRNQDGSIDVTTQKLGILPGLLSTDIAQSIQLIPGISSLDESATGIQIRGGSPDQNLILYDNIKLYNTGYFYGMFSLFNPFATESAKVFRSGTSAVYGDRVSGIIDISSGNSIPEKTNGGFQIDGLSVDGYIKTPLKDNLAVYLFARRSYNDVYRSPTYDSYADKIFTNAGIAKDVNGNILKLETDDDFTPKTSTHKFYFADINAKVIFNPDEKNNITLSALHTENDLEFRFGDDSEKIEDFLNTKNNGLSFKWNHTTNDNQQEEISAYYSNYNSFYKNNELKDENIQNVFEIEEVNLRENKITDVGFSFLSKTKISKKQHFLIGYQLSNTDLKIGISKTKPLEPQENNTDPVHKKNFKNALFSEYTYFLNKKSIIKAGLRLVHYNSVNQVKLEPRINFEYAINKHIRLKYAIEQRNQPISQLVEFNHTELRLENNLWRLSDDIDYPLLSSNQISGGLLFKFKHLNIDIDSYYKTLEGLTTFTSGFSNPLENLEFGESTIKGVDILLKYHFNNYRVWSGYTYNDITFKFPTLKNSLSSFPGNNDIKHSFRISNSFTYNQWDFSLGWQFRSGRPFTPVNSYTIKKDADNEDAGVVNFGNTNSDRLPNFHRLDASILYNFKLGPQKLKSQVGLSALNIYNRIKPLNLIYKAEVKPLDDGGIAKNDGSGENELILEQVIQRFSLGFTPNISFKIFF